MITGTAGWVIPKVSVEAFDTGGSHLERYARVFNGVEINSTFHRSHREQTFARWATSVPAAFRFSLKCPKTITHAARLSGCHDLVERFLSETSALGEKRGPLLLQLPPSFEYSESVVVPFLVDLRRMYEGELACEPRHATWFTRNVDVRLSSLRVARVAADPVLAEGAGSPGGWSGLAYYRWHGWPQIYYSSYEPARLAEFADAIGAEAAPATWCIFDNTAFGSAIGNALDFAHLASGCRA